MWLIRLEHIRGRIMVHGCMSWKGIGELIIIQWTMNNEHYQNILHDDMSTSIMKLKQKVYEWVFQHDNDPKHTSTSTIKWFNDHTITTLPWSPQLLDMNLIKHLWNEVGWCLQLYIDHPISKDDLWKKL